MCAFVRVCACVPVRVQVQATLITVNICTKQQYLLAVAIVSDVSLHVLFAFPLPLATPTRLAPF